jgi:hypothetical protein
MGDVDAMDLVAFGIVDGAIEGAPTEAEGSHEEIIEEPDVTQHDGATSNPPSPGRHLLKKANHDARAFSMPWAVIGLSGSDTFSSDYTFLRHNI